MFCRKCGAKIDDTATTCSACGASVAAVEPKPEATGEPRQEAASAAAPEGGVVPKHRRKALVVATSAVAVAIVLAIVLTSGILGSKSPIVGEWRGSDGIVVFDGEVLRCEPVCCFRRDGTFSLEFESYEYEGRWSESEDLNAFTNVDHEMFYEFRINDSFETGSGILNIGDDGSKSLFFSAVDIGGREIGLMMVP